MTDAGASWRAVMAQDDAALLQITGPLDGGALAQARDLLFSGRGLCVVPRCDGTLGVSLSPEVRRLLSASVAAHRRRHLRVAPIKTRN